MAETPTTPAASGQTPLISTPAPSAANSEPTPATGDTSSSPASTPANDRKSEAAKILAEASAALRRGKAKPGKEETPSTGKASPAGDAPAPATDQSTKTEPADPSKAAGATEPPKTDADKEAAERLSQLVESKRTLDATRAKLEAAHKANEPHIATGKAIHDARSKGDHLGALAAAGYKTAEELSEAMYAIVGALKEPEAFDPTKIPELVDQQVETKLQAAKDAEVKKRREEINTTWQAGVQALAQEAAAELKANADKYPLIRRRGINVDWDSEKGEPVGDVDKFIVAHYQKTRQAPTTTEILEHFEAKYRAAAQAEAEAIGFVPKVAAAPPAPAPANPVSGDWTRDTRGAAPPPTTEKRRGLKEKTDEMLERAAALDAKRRGVAA